jgi:membrane associated rhomboid family serine protease
MLISLLVGILSAGTGAFAGEAAALSLLVVGYAAILVLIVLMTIQRAHDFNTSGWLAILIIVPLVNLIFWFIPGTDGENRFGRKTPPNGIGAILLACIIPMIFVIGIVAAIAIPTYHDAVQRAKAAQVRK